MPHGYDFYIFATEDEAIRYAVQKNKAYRAAGNHRDLVVVVDGPDNDFATMGLDEAIESDFGYRIYHN